MTPRGDEPQVRPQQRETLRATGEACTAADTDALIEEARKVLLSKINQFVPSGFRDEDGVWWEGPHRIEAQRAVDDLADALAWEREAHDDESEKVNHWMTRHREACEQIAAWQRHAQTSDREVADLRKRAMRAEAQADAMEKFLREQFGYEDADIEDILASLSPREER